MPDSKNCPSESTVDHRLRPQRQREIDVDHKALAKRVWPLRLSPVSATTRAIRPGERPGIDYFYLNNQQFEEEIRAGAFLEYAKVHDHYYGTLQREVVPYLQAGTGVILDIDVQGASQVRNNLTTFRFL